MIAALRLALTGRKVLFLLPYISMAKERMQFLQVTFKQQFSVVNVSILTLIPASLAPRRYTGGGLRWSPVSPFQRVDVWSVYNGKGEQSD